MVEIDIESRKLQVVGINGEKCNLEQVEKEFEERRKNWVPKEEKYKSEILIIYSKNAVDPILGVYMK